MQKLNEDSLERKILKECCKETNVDIEVIIEMMKTEEEYAIKSRRYWVTEKLKDIVESRF